MIIKSKKYFESVNLSKSSVDKSASCEVLFTTSFISELIRRSFPKKFKNNKSHQHVSLDSRMRAWNYLSSLLSLEDILDQHILSKTLIFINDYYEKSNHSYSKYN